MTIESNITSQTMLGDGVTKVFPFTFKAPVPNHPVHRPGTSSRYSATKGGATPSRLAAGME